MKIIITESQYELLNEQLYKLFKSSPKIVKPISKTISKSISSELDGLIKTYIQKVGEDEFIKLRKSLLNKEIEGQSMRERYRLINKTENGNKNNKLYILDTQNFYQVLGYSKNGYDVFIY